MFIIIVTNENGLCSVKRAESFDLAKDYLLREVVDTCIEEFGADEFCEKYCYNKEEDAVYIYDSYEELEEEGKVQDFLNFMKDHIEISEENAVVFLNSSKTTFVQISIYDIYSLENLKWEK